MTTKLRRRLLTGMVLLEIINKPRKLILPSNVLHIVLYDHSFALDVKLVSNINRKQALYTLKCTRCFDVAHSSVGVFKGCI